MIGQNDYIQTLYNGDTGLILPSEATSSGSVRAFFPSSETGGYRAILPQRLPQHETAYAITVHKSQGSEFDHVLFILPPTPNQLFTRELLYTAITRAKKKVEIWCTEKVLESLLKTKTARNSGLREMLWG